MTLSEYVAGTSRVSFSAIATGESVRAADPGTTVREVARIVARGGWPGNRELSDARADLRQLEGIRRDVNGAEGVMKDETIPTMIAGLSRLMVVEDLPAWAPALRSRTRLRTAFVRHFVDPSLAVAAVGAVLRGIRVFSQAHDARTFHYRDESGQEVNIVIEFPDGQWIAVAVKLGHSQVNQAAANRIAPRDHVASVCTR